MRLSAAILAVCLSALAACAVLALASARRDVKKAPAWGPSAPHGEVRDPTGDARPNPNVATSPDLVHGTVDVVGTDIIFKIELAPGTFDPATTLLIINLDTDQNPKTGQSMAGDGVDYVLSMGDGQGDQALIGKYAGTPGKFDTVGHAPVSLLTDGMMATVPLSLLGNSSGKLNFRVSAFVHLAGTPTSGALDVMPDVGLRSGQVR